MTKEQEQTQLAETGARIRKLRETNELSLHELARLCDTYRRDDGRYDILHTGQLILVDQRGVLRGLYETDRDGLALLERHARQLAED